MQSLIFFGSDQYSAIVLANLLTAKNIQLLAVVTDQNLGGSPVEKLAKKHALPVSYYPVLPPKLPTGIVGLCASFDHLLPQAIIKHFGGRLYNLHPSLLPQYRNVSPVQYALALGDTETGITLFRISAGIDNGQIISQAEEPILPTDTTPTLTARLFTQGAQLFTDWLTDTPTRRPADQPTRRLAEPLIFTRRLTRASGFIEWPVLQKLLQNQPVTQGETTSELLKLRLTHNPVGNILADLIRALSPWPGVWSLVPTKKGELRLSVESVLPRVTVKLAGKPKPITYADFIQYYC